MSRTLVVFNNSSNTRLTLNENIDEVCARAHHGGLVFAHAAGVGDVYINMATVAYLQAVEDKA